MGDNATLSWGIALMRKASPVAFWPFAARVRRVAPSVSVGLAGDGAVERGSRVRHESVHAGVQSGRDTAI